MTCERIEYEVEHPLATITLNRRRERGLRAALDWRDEQFREVEALA